MKSENNIERFKDQVNFIRTSTPDIVCLQEYNTHDIADAYANLFNNGYKVVCKQRPRPNSEVSYFLAKLSRQIPHDGLRNFITGPQLLGVSIWYKHDTFELVKTSSEEFDRLGNDFLNIFRKRGFTNAYFKHRLSQRIIRVVTTHMSLVTSQDRLYQGKQIIKTLLRDKRHPIVLTGDFNTVDMSEPVLKLFEYFLHRVNTSATFCHSNQNKDWLGKLLTVNGDRHPDHLLVSPSITVLNHSLVDIFSDHQGIFAYLYSK